MRVWRLPVTERRYLSDALSGLGIGFDQYIVSKAWRRRVGIYARSHPARCAFCGASDGLTLHHWTYKRLGAELDSDLCWACRPCHSALHLLWLASPEQYARLWRSVR